MWSNPDDKLNILLANGYDYLEDKIRYIESFKVEFEDIIPEQFKCHVDEVLDKAKENIRHAKLSSNNFSSVHYYTNANLYLDILTNQVEKVKISIVSRKLDRYDSLRLVLDEIINDIDFSPSPNAIFGGAYYSTGTFVYTENVGELSEPYYQVSISAVDPTLIWPILGHEIGHCLIDLKLDESWVNITNKYDLFDQKYERRVEEALCDILGTKYFGPSYLFAFNTITWYTGSSQADFYPNLDFRLKLINDVLRDYDFDYIFRNFSDYISFDERNAKKEDINLMKDDIITISEDIFESVSFNSYNLIDGLDDVARNDIKSLFNVAWLELLSGDYTFNYVSTSVDKILKRWSSGSNTST